jgi:hypothetical protein
VDDYAGPATLSQGGDVLVVEVALVAVTRDGHRTWEGTATGADDGARLVERGELTIQASGLGRGRAVGVLEGGARVRLEGDGPPPWESSPGF